MTSTTEERVDELKLDYIANRSERGRIAVEALKASRLEKLKKMAGRKDD
jgi:COX assembly protein 1